MLNIKILNFELIILFKYKYNSIFIYILCYILRLLQGEEHHPQINFYTLNRNLMTFNSLEILFLKLFI